MPSVTKENPLGYEKISRLLKNFAIPSIIAMLVSSLYNIVDQIFIGQGVGYLGNAATNVSYPLTTICLAIALLIGIGSASRFSLYLGAGEQKNAARIVGNAFCMMITFGIVYTVLIEIFLTPLLTAFGSTPDVMPYAESYTRITAIGMPLLIVTNGMSSLARSDGSPRYSMTCMLIGAVINTILDPIFIFVFDMGVAGAAIATVDQTVLSFLMAIRYLKKFQKHSTEAGTFSSESKRQSCHRLSGDEQQSEPGGNHTGTDRYEQFSDILRRTFRIWKRNSSGCLRNCHENKCNLTGNSHRNFSGNTADHRF